MSNFNKDFLGRQADPRDLATIVHRLMLQLNQTGQGYVHVEDLDEIANSPGNLPIGTPASSSELCAARSILPGAQVITAAGTPQVVIHDQGGGLIFTESFNESEPGWYIKIDGLTLAQAQSINLVKRSKNKTLYVGCTTSGTSTFMARAEPGGQFVVIVDYASIVALYGSSDSVRVATFDCNPLVADQCVYVLSQAGENCRTFIGNDGVFTAGATFVVNTNNGSDVSYGAGGWLFTGNGYVLLSAAASAVVRSGVIGAFTCTRHARPATMGDTIHWMDTGGKLAIGEDNCNTITNGVGDATQDASYLYNDKLAVDPTGQYMMTRNNATDPIRSGDGGETWEVMSSLASVINWYFVYAGGAGAASRWIAVGLDSVYYTDNFGDTWTDKSGNLADVAPSAILDAVKVLEL